MFSPSLIGMIIISVYLFLFFYKVYARIFSLSKRIARIPARQRIRRHLSMFRISFQTALFGLGLLNLPSITPVIRALRRQR